MDFAQIYGGDSISGRLGHNALAESLLNYKSSFSALYEFQVCMAQVLNPIDVLFDRLMEICHKKGVSANIFVGK
jgi:hypothetical protein